MIPQMMRTIFKRLGLLLLAYSFARFLFLVWNFKQFHNDSFWEIAQAIIYGVRFDLSAILYTNALLLLIWMLPSKWLKKPLIARFDRILFGLVNFFFIGLSFIDVEFNRFIGKRISYEYFFLHQDIQEQTFSILLTYWPLLSMLFTLTGLLVWFYPKAGGGEKKEGFVSGTLWRLALVALTILGMRGGFGFKPVHPMDASFSTRQELGTLTLNSAFNVIKTRNENDVVLQHYYPNLRDAIARVKALTEPTRPPLGLLKGFNVVVILLESFSLEDIGAANDYAGYTPFFDELAKKSFFFKYNVANARRSIDGVAAVFCGIPTLMGESIIMTDFIHNRMDCLPRFLVEAGYDTYFMHGAHNGSMHFDSFAPIAGFQHFVGLNEFPDKNEENIDPSWGVVDESMLQYAAQTLTDAKKPTFIGLFTLSSHHPYWIPPHLRGKFPKGENEIDESLGYTDYSLRKFFETASTKPWFNKTIFVFTGDHIHPIDRKKYYTEVGVWRVPLMFYIPGLKQHLDVSPDRITQHADILPSVLDLLGIDRKERFLLGQSVFDAGLTGRAYNYYSSGYMYLDPKYYINYSRIDGSARVATHNKTWDLDFKILPSEENRKIPEVQDLLAIADYFNWGLLNNSFYDYKKLLEPKPKTSDSGK
jgi:phosphoglycerol transferase MdoB-like AlkP superfamily enzyme